MTKEKKTAAKPEEDPEDDGGEEDTTASERRNMDQEETKGLIGQANEAAERIEKSNKELKKLLDKQESMKAEEALGGQTEAGKKEKTKKDIANESAKKMMEGVGLDPFEGEGEKALEK